MANDKQKSDKPKKSRTVKPKQIFMIYAGEKIDETQVSFTKDALEVLNQCGGNSGKSYIRVTLPAPKARPAA